MSIGELSMGSMDVRAFAIPKSASLMWPSHVAITLFGDTSRCTMSSRLPSGFTKLWAKSSARQTRLAMYAACTCGIGFPSSRWRSITIRSVGPLMYSIDM